MYDRNTFVYREYEFSLHIRIIDTVRHFEGQMHMVVVCMDWTIYVKYG